MSTTYLTALAAVVVVVVISRFVIGVLPIDRFAVRTGAVDIALLVVGVLALVLHCGAMFFRSDVSRLPGGPGVITIVDPLGAPSITWFAVASFLVVVAFRRQNPMVLALVAASLVAVGYTMYDGGPLHTHLTAIFVSIVMVAVVAARLVLTPWGGGPANGRLRAPRLGS